MFTVASCDSPKQKKPETETLNFRVDESLLEPRITDPHLQISLAPPKNWYLVEQSVLDKVRSSLHGLETGEHINMKWVFLNQELGGVCTVSELVSPTNERGEVLVDRLERECKSAYPDAEVKGGVFMKDDLRIHQVMAISSDSVAIKMLIDGPAIRLFALDYVVPKRFYARELRAIESSIGSIALVTQ
jgi:hypothetical protein